MSAPWAAHGGLISHYDSLVCSGSLREDDQQRAALLQLEQLNRVMTDYTNIPILVAQPKDCLHSQPTSELKNNTSKVNLCSPQEKMSNEKEDRDVDNTQEVCFYMCQTEQCNLWMFTVKKKLSSPTFSQIPALALCHCLICCGTVVCRSKQLQPVCVCGGGEWEERPDQALAGSQHGPLLSQDTPPIPRLSNEGSPLSGKEIPSSTFNMGK